MLVLLLSFDISRAEIKHITLRFFMQTISQSKLKSFSIGMMNAGLKKPAKSKQDAEEKKKVSVNCLLRCCNFPQSRKVIIQVYSFMGQNQKPVY